MASTLAYKDAFFGHLHPERFEYPVLYKNLGHYQFQGCHLGSWADAPTAGAVMQASAI